MFDFQERRPKAAYAPSPALRAGADKRNRSRDALMRPSFANRDDAKNRFASGKQREAERRKAHAIHVRAAQTSVRSCATHLLRGCAPTISSLPRLRGRVREGARPPFGAHACGTRHRLSPRWLSPEPGFPKTDFESVLPARPSCLRLSTLRADRSFCRSTGDPEPPGSGLAIPRAGTAPRFRLSGLPFRKGALTERSGRCVTGTGTVVKR